MHVVDYDLAWFVPYERFTPKGVLTKKKVRLKKQPFNGEITPGLIYLTISNGYCGHLNFEAHSRRLRRHAILNRGAVDRPAGVLKIYKGGKVYSFEGYFASVSKGQFHLHPCYDEYFNGELRRLIIDEKLSNRISPANFRCLRHEKSL